MQPSGPDLALRFFPGTGASYDRVVRLTTLGLDALWKRRLLARVPRGARAVLDLACGTGIVTLELLRRLPGARVHGVDLTEDYLDVARRKVRRRGGNATFVLGDAVTTPVPGPFDAIVSSYLPKYVDADRLVVHLTPALRPGGVIALHDFTHPGATLPRLVWAAYFAVLNPLARRAFRDWGQVFDASLEGLIRRTRWVAAFRRALRRHGYERVTVERLTFGAAAVVSGVRPPDPR